jgi:hypothetical protein
VSYYVVNHVKDSFYLYIILTTRPWSGPWSLAAHAAGCLSHEDIWGATSGYAPRPSGGLRMSCASPAGSFFRRRGSYETTLITTSVGGRGSAGSVAARAKTEIGAFPSRLAVRLGWTVDMVKYRRRLAQYKALIGDEHDRTARELREDTLSPLESSGRPPAAAAPPSTPSAGPDSPGSRLEPLGPASSPVMGSTSLSAPPMEGWPGRVVWVDPPLGKIASSPGLHISQVAGGSSAAAPLPMDSSTSSCPPSSDVSPNREVLGSPEGAAGSLLALVSPESTLAFAQDNDKY